MSGSSPHRNGTPAVPLVAAGGLGLCLLWAYWPTLLALENRWATDPQSSHGFVVPLYAAIVLWARRAAFPALPWRLNPWGLVVIAGASVFRLAGAYVHVDWIDGAALLASLVGVTFLAGGVPLLKWAWPGFALLLFMLPQPYQVEVALAAPLQRVGTVAAVYALQTLGYAAVPEGNVIVINELRLEVANACNGLGMLSAFFALSTAVAFVIRRPLYERAVVFLSAVPIGLAANVIRITATGWAHHTLGTPTANALFHDYAGWLMTPLALVALGAELWLLRRLVVERTASRPVPVPVAVPPPAPAPAPAPAAAPNTVADRPATRTRQLAPAAPAGGPGPTER